MDTKHCAVDGRDDAMPALLPGVENADEGGVHGVDEVCRRRPASMGAGGAVVGEVPVVV
ncbi:hypothetical protein ACWCXX_38085 [Streptomyces sp. NPDC001732]